MDILKNKKIILVDAKIINFRQIIEDHNNGYKGVIIDEKSIVNKRFDKIILNYETKYNYRHGYYYKFIPFRGIFFLSTKKNKEYMRIIDFAEIHDTTIRDIVDYVVDNINKDFPKKVKYSY